LKLSADEVEVLEKLRVLKSKAMRVPPMLLIRVVNGRFQLFSVTPAGLVAFGQD
jgi:hypothetical protein